MHNLIEYLLEREIDNEVYDSVLQDSHLLVSKKDNSPKWVNYMYSNVSSTDQFEGWDRNTFRKGEEQRGQAQSTAR